jgi:hypothetical protein
MFSKFTTHVLLGLAAMVSAQNPAGAELLRAKSNSTSLAYNGFYLSTYHQGAGFADATLVANQSEAIGGAFLNATNDPNLGEYYLDFNTSIAAGNETIYYSAQIYSGGGYNTMSIMTINLASGPQGGFDIDAEGRLSYENGTSWAACDWIHAVRITPFPVHGMRLMC